MREYRCQNGDLIRVGGVYLYDDDGVEEFASIVEVNKNNIRFGLRGMIFKDNYYSYFKSELPRDKDNYYIWDGGKQPVPDEWVVEVHHLSTGCTTTTANKLSWYKSAAMQLKSTNIIAFRVVSTGEEYLSKRDYKVTNPEVREPKENNIVNKDIESILINMGWTPPDEVNSYDSLIENLENIIHQIIASEGKCLESYTVNKQGCTIKLNKEIVLA